MLNFEPPNLGPDEHSLSLTTLNDNTFTVNDNGPELIVIDPNHAMNMNFTANQDPLIAKYTQNSTKFIYTERLSRPPSVYTQVPQIELMPCAKLAGKIRDVKRALNISGNQEINLQIDSAGDHEHRQFNKDIQNFKENYMVKKGSVNGVNRSNTRSRSRRNSHNHNQGSSSKYGQRDQDSNNNSINSMNTNSQNNGTSDINLNHSISDSNFHPPQFLNNLVQGTSQFKGDCNHNNGAPRLNSKNINQSPQKVQQHDLLLTNFAHNRPQLATVQNGNHGTSTRTRPQTRQQQQFSTRNPNSNQTINQAQHQQLQQYQKPPLKPPVHTQQIPDHSIHAWQGLSQGPELQDSKVFMTTSTTTKNSEGPGGSDGTDKNHLNVTNVITSKSSYSKKSNSSKSKNKKFNAADYYLPEPAQNQAPNNNFHINEDSHNSRISSKNSTNSNTMLNNSKISSKLSTNNTWMKENTNRSRSNSKESTTAQGTTTDGTMTGTLTGTMGPEGRSRSNSKEDSSLGNTYQQNQNQIQNQINDNNLGGNNLNNNLNNNVNQNTLNQLDNSITGTIQTIEQDLNQQHTNNDNQMMVQQQQYQQAQYPDVDFGFSATIDNDIDGDSLINLEMGAFRGNALHENSDMMNDQTM